MHVYLCFLLVLLLSPIILFSSEESSSFADMLNVDRQVMSRNVTVVGLFVKWRCLFMVFSFELHKPVDKTVFLT